MKLRLPLTMVFVTTTMAGLCLSLPACADGDAEGVKLFQEGKIDQAIERFKALVQAHPNDAGCHYSLGICYARKNDQAHAEEHLQWVMLHSTDAHWRQESDRALRSLHEGASRATPVADQKAPVPRVGTVSRIGPATQKSPGANTGAREISPMERALQQAQANIIEQKIRLQRETAVRIEDINRSVTAEYNDEIRSFGFREAFRRYNDRMQRAERDKRDLTAAAQKQMAAWDATIEEMKMELAHPGKRIQLVPQNINPYVKSFMNMGDEEPPPEVVPLRAKAERIGDKKTKP
jgi:tetratricopeptide (TPR) repeat protein